jgi:hypothetical protein
VVLFSVTLGAFRYSVCIFRYAGGIRYSGSILSTG